MWHDGLRLCLALPEELHAGLDHPRIVAASGLGLQFFEAGAERERRALRTRREHGLDRVGDREDARLEQDVLAAQPARIARAVEPLMVLAHRLGHGPGEFDAAQQVVAALGV